MSNGRTIGSRLVGQSFTPFARATDQDIAAHLYQVALKADAIEAKLAPNDKDAVFTLALLRGHGAAP